MWWEERKHDERQHPAAAGRITILLHAVASRLLLLLVAVAVRLVLERWLPVAPSGRQKSVGGINVADVDVDSGRRGGEEEAGGQGSTTAAGELEGIVTSCMHCTYQGRCPVS